MQKAQFIEYKRRFAAERRIKYRGTASVHLEVLHFACEKDEGNVARLKNFFRKNGCDRLDIQNHLPAIINQEQLDAAIRLSETSAEALMGHPRDNYTEPNFPPNILSSSNTVSINMESLDQLDVSLTTAFVVKQFHLIRLVEARMQLE